MHAWKRKYALIGSVIAVMLAAGLILRTAVSERPPHPARLASIVVIDSNIGEVFAPAPHHAAPKLTAEQAFAQQRLRNGRSVIPVPSGVTVSLGLLTIPAGRTNPHTGHIVTKDGIAYAALRELAWGYSSHWCPMSRNPAAPGRVAGSCTRWSFLDANTGREIDETLQQ